MWIATDAFDPDCSSPEGGGEMLWILGRIFPSSSPDFLSLLQLFNSSIIVDQRKAPISADDVLVAILVLRADHLAVDLDTLPEVVLVAIDERVHDVQPAAIFGFILEAHDTLEGCLVAGIGYSPVPGADVDTVTFATYCRGEVCRSSGHRKYKISLFTREYSAAPEMSSASEAVSRWQVEVIERHLAVLDVDIKGLL
jgi:hypothetical protein